MSCEIPNHESEEKPGSIEAPKARKPASPFHSIHSTVGPMVYTSPVLGDLDKDGSLEVIAGNYGGDIYALVASNGTELWNVSTYVPLRSDPALGDIDNDDHLEIVCGDYDGNIYCLEGSDGSVVWNHSIGAPFEASPVIGDIDGNGNLEIVIGDTNGVMYCLEGNTGALIWNYTVNSMIWRQVSLGDLNNDGDLEVAFGGGRGGMYILDGITGNYIWNVPTDGRVSSTPILNDFNNDGILDIFVGSRDNNAYLLKGEVGARPWVFQDTDIGIAILSAGAVLTLVGISLYMFRINQVKKNTPAEIDWSKAEQVFQNIKDKPNRVVKKDIEYNIQTSNLKKVYGNRFSKESVVAVNGIDLVVKSGIHGFLGPNGAGKTTTMKMLIGALPITSGSAKLKGFEAGSLHAKDLVGYMPQELGFYRRMTGEEYLIYMARLSGMGKTTAIQAAKFLLAKFELEDAADRQLSKYSSGMVQKIGLAASFINIPEILILDEPTSDLDPIGRNTIINHIKALSEDVGIFVSSHILSEIEQMCDTVSIINNGELILTDTIENLKTLYGDGTFRFIIDTGDNRELLTRLEEQPFIEQVSINPKTNNINVITKDVSKMERFIKEILIDLDISLKKFTQEEVSLQDIFLQLVQSEEGEKL